MCAVYGVCRVRCVRGRVCAVYGGAVGVVCGVCSRYDGCRVTAVQGAIRCAAYRAWRVVGAVYSGCMASSCVQRVVCAAGGGCSACCVCVHRVSRAVHCVQWAVVGVACGISGVGRGGCSVWQLQCNAWTVRRQVCRVLCVAGGWCSVWFVCVHRVPGV